MEVPLRRLDPLSHPNSPCTITTPCPASLPTPPPPSKAPCHQRLLRSSSSSNGSSVVPTPGLAILTSCLFMPQLRSPSRPPPPFLPAWPAVCLAWFRKLRAPPCTPTPQAHHCTCSSSTSIPRCMDCSTRHPTPPSHLSLSLSSSMLRIKPPPPTITSWRRVCRCRGLTAPTRRHSPRPTLRCSIPQALPCLQRTHVSHRTRLPLAQAPSSLQCPPPQQQ
mmetsp:Transcript_6846/g.18365  ORF Transcript_6846/g.18365 Transcript_6846/m.18365 type:complete len:220 (+) Transcript_6846:356-1015(+)